MCKTKSAYIFPGITNISNMRDSVHEVLIQWIKPYNYSLSELLSKDVLECISNKSYHKLNDFDRQVIGYTASCAVYDAYIKRRGLSEYISGYSMGIFGALYAARSISFMTGISLLHSLDQVIEKSFGPDDKFSMATVIGLSRMQLREAIEKCGGIDIVNQNSELSLVVSGWKNEIGLLEDTAFKAGAVLFKQLPIERPYHSSLLLKCRDEWMGILGKEEIGNPRTPVISPTTAGILADRKGCIAELENNFCSSFSWLDVLKVSWEIGVRDMYECGASRDLARIGKYSGFAHQYHEF
ncbi:hypothetical protein [Methylobacter sp. YRD-M1]|uniref:hypothetical protein n=1 Tax=Methylobacter sp. YRD-M1 TaxID=2911520 RepID=UPI00227A13FB|nr:hypothetical protein [Methylobacter sp. YRD-M1]WAK01063.1 hypothetical protein LZ558_14625 [Methylobacter sp. YRD-M1]